MAAIASRQVEITLASGWPQPVQGHLKEYGNMNRFAYLKRFRLWWMFFNTHHCFIVAVRCKIFEIYLRTAIAAQATLSRLARKEE